jgi:hypothetical protein
MNERGLTQNRSQTEEVFQLGGSQAAFHEASKVSSTVGSRELTISSKPLNVTSSAVDFSAMNLSAVLLS